MDKWLVFYDGKSYRNTFSIMSTGMAKTVNTVPAVVPGDYYVVDNQNEVLLCQSRVLFDVVENRGCFSEEKPDILWRFDKQTEEFSVLNIDSVTTEYGKLVFLGGQTSQSQLEAILEMLFCVLNYYNQYLGEKIKQSMFLISGGLTNVVSNLYAIMNRASIDSADKVFSAMGDRYFFTQLSSQDGFELAVGCKKARQVIGLPDKVLEFVKNMSQAAALTGHMKTLCSQDANEGMFVIDYLQSLREIKTFSVCDEYEERSFISSLAEIKTAREDVNIPRLIRYLIKQKIYYGCCQYKQPWGSRTKTTELFTPPYKEAKTYFDYLNMMPANGDLYPRILLAAHNVCVRNIKITQDAELAEKFYKTAASLEPLDYEGKDFIMTHPHTVEELVEEGNTLEHCVATYAGTIANGQTRVMFLRQKDAPTVPFVTVEIDEDFNLVQIKGKYDIDVTDPEVLDFAKEWRKEKKS